MKNLVPKQSWARRLATARGLAALLGVCFAVSGCKTNPGADFSSMPSAAAKAKPAGTAQKPQTEPIVLRDGDVVHVAFPGSSSLDTTQQIRRDGKIVMPLVGEVVAAGKTPEELQNDLLKLYAPQVNTTQIIVTVQSSTFPVYITGAVLRPGEIQSDHPLTALEAIMKAGGFDYSKANLKDVVIIRQENNGTTRFTVNLKKMMSGAKGRPFYLKPSDIVYVPERFNWF